MIGCDWLLSYSYPRMVLGADKPARAGFSTDQQGMEADPDGSTQGALGNNLYNSSLSAV